MPKLGRPPKPKAEKQSVRLMANFTLQELVLIRKAAGKEPLAAWLRKVVLRAANRAN